MWGNDPDHLSFQGYFLLFESMLDSVLHARDLYLADGGSGRSHLQSLQPTDASRDLRETAVTAGLRDGQGGGGGGS